MIKRFSSITQVGVFREAKSLGSHEFNKFTLLYSLNTFGKTTLKDIFLSLGDNDPTHIQQRISIPRNTKLSQEVKLSFLENGSGKNLLFNGRSWSDDALFGKIHVFDNDFIHKNLMAGCEITRANKESLSDFIIGEEGVTISNEIQELNRKLGEKTRSLRRPEFVKNESDEAAENFARILVSENRNDLEKERERLIKEIDNYSKIEEINGLPKIVFPEISIIEDLAGLISLINTELEKEYNVVDDNIVEILHQHIMNETKNNENIDSWIKDGFLKHKNSDNCPFCGQDISAVEQLIDCYRNIFSSEYETFSERISRTLAMLKTDLQNLSIGLLSEVRKSIIILQKYKKYDPSVSADISLDELETKEENTKTLFKNEVDRIKKIIDKKKGLPHKKIDNIKIDCSLIDSVTELKDKFALVLEKLEDDIEKAENLKEKYIVVDEEKTRREIELSNTSLKGVNKKIARIDQDQECKAFLKTAIEIDTLKQQITQKTKDLKSQQSDYLRNYFDKLNVAFKKFGSNNFLLESSSSSRGHKKIYELNVTYHGEKLSPDKLNKVMSESDKRSLALSIFLTKLLDIQNKEEIIIVLDDPVVSFDSNRISVSVDEIKDLLNDFRQVIVLTHYPSLVKRILKVQIDGSFLEITKDHNGSSIALLEKKDFVLSDYEKAFEVIYCFINRENEKDILKDCRVFMEKHLKITFQKDIKDKSIRHNCDLSAFLKNLYDEGCLTNTKYNELENFRKGLNPDHHDFSDGNKEDIRTYANDLLECLFSITKE